MTGLYSEICPLGYTVAAARYQQARVKLRGQRPQLEATLMMPTAFRFRWQALSGKIFSRTLLLLHLVSQPECRSSNVVQKLY